MDFVQDYFPRAKPVPSFWVVRVAFHDALVLAPLNNLFSVIVMLIKLRFPSWRLQHVNEIQHGAFCLILVVRANINVVATYGIVGRYGARAIKGNKSILPSATANHSKKCFPSRTPSPPPVGAVPQGEQKFFPRE